jgi:hypothetical protein
MHHPSLKQESERTGRLMKEVTSRGLKTSKDPKNVVNVIFGGDRGFPSKRAQKLTLRKILSIEPATTRPLRYSEVPISFSKDDQWISFSEPGKFPLIRDPVVAGS